MKIHSHHVCHFDWKGLTTMTRETDNKDDDDDEETWGEVKNLSTLSNEN